MSDPRPEPTFMKPEIYDPETPSDEGQIVENPNIHALTQLNAAEINQQIMTARAYPRSITSFRRSMREMVTYDQPTALSCLYALKRSGKLIEGPSIRFAEAALQAWGNARAGSRIVDIGDEFITAQGFFYDLEKNMAVAFEVLRRITDREGNRYGEDMIMVTGNAAGSIALRNAITRGIPMTAWGESYQEARQCSIGKGESITVKRENMIKAFAPLNVDRDQIFGLLGVKGVEDVSVDHMIMMGGILNSIKQGDVTVEKAFAPENMINPEQVRPQQPQRSEFRREPASTGKPDPKKPDATKAAGAEPEKAVAAEGGEGKVTSGDGGGRDRDQSQVDWIRDMYSELAGLKKVRDVVDLRDKALEVGVFTAEEESQWIIDCKAKSDALMKKPK